MTEENVGIVIGPIMLMAGAEGRHPVTETVFDIRLGSRASGHFSFAVGPAAAAFGHPADQVEIVLPEQLLILGVAKKLWYRVLDQELATCLWDLACIKQPRGAKTYTGH